jgi:hypothetical protein
LDDIEDAYDGKLSSDEIEDALQDLVDLGAVFEKVNPITKEKEYKLDDNTNNMDD